MAANLARIRESIGGAPVTLIAVTKNVGIEAIEEAYQSGVTEFGENRVQDALEKQTQVPADMAPHIHWHLIGHLQTNKVKKVVGKFALIHSVDSLNLARELSSAAVKAGVVQNILLQVKILPDPTKSGFAPGELQDQIKEILALPGVFVRGLMTMAPLSPDKLVWHASFAGLSALKDELEQTHKIELKELSMGMTEDWQEAVRCGATMIRLGRAIFGEPATRAGRTDN